MSTLPILVSSLVFGYIKLWETVGNGVEKARREKVDEHLGNYLYNALPVFSSHSLKQVL